jgi:hypothetical protein
VAPASAPPASLPRAVGTLAPATAWAVVPGWAVVAGWAVVPGWAAATGWAVVPDWAVVPGVAAVPGVGAAPGVAGAPGVGAVVVAVVSEALSPAAGWLVAFASPGACEAGASIVCGTAAGSAEVAWPLPAEPAGSAAPSGVPAEPETAPPALTTPTAVLVPVDPTVATVAPATPATPVDPTAATVAPALLVTAAVAASAAPSTAVVAAAVPSLGLAEAGADAADATGPCPGAPSPVDALAELARLAPLSELPVTLLAAPVTGPLGAAPVTVAGFAVALWF